MQINTDAEGKLELDLFTTERTIQSAMLSSVMTQLGSFVFNTSHGSAHHGIDKITDDTLELLESQLTKALQWLIDIGRAVSTDVSAVQVAQHRIRIDQSAVQADGQEISYSVFKPVG